MEHNTSQDMALVHSSSLQMMPIKEAQEWYNAFGQFTQSILKKDLDYGVIPGTPKPSLYKAGAEKLRFAYGLTIEFDMIEKTVDLDKLFVDYTYKCTVKSKQGQVLAQCEGNCNSMEAKFGYVWVPENELPKGADLSRLKSRVQGKKISEFGFALDKKETGGQYGKPAEYWQMWEEAIQSGRAKKVLKKSKAGKEMDAWELDDQVTLYRVTNPDVIGLKNTIMKMAQKRAFVGAILLATGASEYFTQDIEDMEFGGRIYSDDNHIEDAVVIEEVKNEAPQQQKGKKAPAPKAEKPAEKPAEKAEDTPPPPPSEPHKQKLSDVGFQKAIKRIEAGEKGVGDKLKASFDLSPEQLNYLAKAEKAEKPAEAEVVAYEEDLPF
jgi:hypothetical protein